jgi:hypothetical protein
MPKGPQGQKRPADVIGNAVHVMRIAIGEVQETPAKSGRTKSGKAGGAARAGKLTAEKQSQVAKKAAAARWK